MTQHTSWNVTEPGKTPVRQKPPEKDKLPFWAPIEMDNLPKGQKEWAERYNAMQKTLIDNGLMNKK